MPWRLCALSLLIAAACVVAVEDAATEALHGSFINKVVRLLGMNYTRTGLEASKIELISPMTAAQCEKPGCTPMAGSLSGAPAARQDCAASQCQTCVKTSTTADGTKVWTLPNGSVRKASDEPKLAFNIKNVEYNQCTTCADKDTMLYVKGVVGGVQVGCCGDGTEREQPLYKSPAWFFSHEMDSELRGQFKPIWIMEKVNECSANECYSDDTNSDDTIRGKFHANSNRLVCNRHCYFGGANTLLHDWPRRKTASKQCLHSHESEKATLLSEAGCKLSDLVFNGVEATEDNPDGAGVHENNKGTVEARCIFQKVIVCDRNRTYNPTACEGGATHTCAREKCVVTKKATCHAIVPYDSTGKKYRKPTAVQKEECGKLADPCGLALRMQ